MAPINDAARRAAAIVQRDDWRRVRRRRDVRRRPVPELLRRPGGQPVRRAPLGERAPRSPAEIEIEVFEICAAFIRSSVHAPNCSRAQASSELASHTARFHDHLSRGLTLTALCCIVLFRFVLKSALLEMASFGVLLLVEVPPI